MIREGFAGDLEEGMRRAFYDEFEADIPIKRIALFDEEGNPRTDAVTQDDYKHSQWYGRNTLWLYSQGQNP
jgi:hypothetical protein